MRRNIRHLFAFLPAFFPLLTLAATNRPDRIELRLDSEVVRIAPGANESAASGSYDVRIYSLTNGNELLFVDGLVLPREGTIKKAWYCDLNNDGQPELAVWIASTDGEARGQFDLLYWAESNRLERAEMPEIPNAWLRGYRGHDSFRIENGLLLRAFPVFRERDPADNHTGGGRTLKLIYEKDRWMWRLHSVK